MAETEAIVLFAHGARDAEWAEPFHKLQRMIAARKPVIPVELAFLEIMQPSLPDAIAKLANRGIEAITVIPVFFARGGHLKQDVPALLADIEKRHATVRIKLTPAIGEVDAILTAIAAWACAVA